MITLDEAREIAYAWHGGGGSPLYSFASTSGHGTPQNITPDTVQEVADNLDAGNCDSEEDVENLWELGQFLVSNLDTPYQDGRFSNLPAQPEEE